MGINRKDTRVTVIRALDAMVEMGGKQTRSKLPIPTKPPVYNGMIAPRDSWMMPPPVTR
jgi:hypothetical protein